jgi:lipopolysaccharide export system protein LptA
MRNILFVALFFVPVLLDAQNVQQDTLVVRDTPEKTRIRTINSDRTVQLENQIVRFWHNVEMEHEGAILECDSAVLWQDRTFEAFGNTKITKGSTVVTGDRMIYSEITGKAKVTGRIVYLTDSSSTLKTVEMDFDTGTEIGYFEKGGVVIDSFRILESRKGYYYSKTKEFEFIGQVQSDTKDYVLQSDTMTYNSNTKNFKFYSNTHIWSGDDYLHCNKGWYDSDRDIMFFHRDSYILSPKQEIFADSIYYEGKDKKGRMYSNIQVVDTVRKTVALADFADFNMNTENFLMRKNPSVIMYDDKDSVFLRADTLYSVTHTVKMPVIKKDTLSHASDTTVYVADTVFSVENMVFSATDTVLGIADTAAVQDETEYTDSTYRELFAFGNVKMYRSDYQLKCDSMYFNNLDSICRVYNNPILWNGEKMQITSDSMKFHIKNQDLDHADFNGNAMLVSPEAAPDSAVYFHQIKSKNMKTHLEDGNLVLFEAMGNVQTIFFILTDFTMNKTEASSLKMSFNSGKIHYITYYDQVPVNNNPFTEVRENEILLPGYRWEIELRPKSGTDVLNRTLRPSERTDREALEKPEFPIKKKMEELEQRNQN